MHNNYFWNIRSFNIWSLRWKPDSGGNNSNDAGGKLV